MAKYLVQYSTPEFRKLLIVIWAKDHEEVRKMLKRHLGNTLFKINRITEEDVIDEEN